MKVFASQFLEPISSEQVAPLEKWKWQPHNKDIAEIYASGAKTSTRASTFCQEKDINADTDRLNEGR